MSKHIYICKPTDDKGCDWYCDNCGTLLNIQDGFTTSSDSWTCTECGEVNDVSYNNIIDDDDDDGDDETISVWDAAEIWASNGMDEDYMFGYTEEELKNAL